MLLSISGLFLFGILIIYFIGRIQFVEGEHWRDLSDSLTVKYRMIPPVRGSIYADQGELLATSMPLYKISLDFDVIAHRHKDSFPIHLNALAANFSNTFGNRSATEYKALLNRAFRQRDRYFLITRNASFLQVKQLRTWPIMREGRYKGGVIIEERTKREKPYGPIMARTIGFVNENGRGAGLEASFNDALSGDSGKILVQRISGGYRPLNDEFAVKPKNGDDVFTTLNVELQDIVHAALLRGVQTYDAQFGTAILLETATGQIKAMANLTRSGEEYLELFNHAVGTLYEPGSTAKLFSAIALLDGNHLKPSDSIDIEWGKTRFYDRIIEDSDAGRYNKLSFQQIFELSSNVGFSKSIFKAFQKDPDEFLDIFNRLHLDKAIDIGIRGAGNPEILNPKSPGWSGTALPSMSIGYSMQLTPMHVAMVYNAIANNGRMVKPYLIRGIGALGSIHTEYEPTSLSSSICNASDIKTLREFLEGVVLRGTARSLSTLPFPVAGKTGTARIAYSGKYEEYKYNSSFVGYFPANDPKYTALVLISEPKGSYYGSTVAVPVFKEIAQKVYARAVRSGLPDSLDVQYPAMLTGQYADLKRVAKEFEFKIPGSDLDNSDWIRLQRDSTAYKVHVVGSNNRMPDLSGFGLSDALYLLENKGHKVRFTGHGKVRKQAPEPGAPLAKGQTIYLQLSTRT